MAPLAIANSLRTGWVAVDVLLALLVPFVLAFFTEGRGRKLLDSWHALFFSKTRHKNESLRIITHATSARYPWGANADNRNDSLQKALALYWSAHGVTYSEKAQVSLTNLRESRGYCHQQPDKYNPLKLYRLVTLAPEGEWVDIGEGVLFRQSRQTEDGGNGQGAESKQVQQIYELRSRHGPERIDAMIARALEWYKQELLALRDESRYLYTLVTTEALALSSKGGKEEEGLRYKRYALSDHKTFESLFFPDKPGLLATLDDFTQRRGRFATKGFPHKLGVLLHGPPGTGKTSLIKALAHATGRSLVSIPLAQIKTNQMLMDVMYDLKLNVEGCADQGPSLSFSDVIFVIEDIDACSKVVLRRDSQPPSAPADDENLARMKDAAAAVGDTSLASLLAAGRAAAAAQPSSGPLAEGPKPPTMADLMGDLIKPRPDELNLAGVLNVLDGVVDTPGRIVVITSNHPEKLDPALIRPGRIDRQIHLGHVRFVEASQMLSHYFGHECSEAQIARLEASLQPDGTRLTPAALEQLCARFVNIDELLDALEGTAPVPDADNSKEGTSLVGTGTAPRSEAMRHGSKEVADTGPLPEAIPERDKTDTGSAAVTDTDGAKATTDVAPLADPEGSDSVTGAPPPDTIPQGGEIELLAGKVPLQMLELVQRQASGG